MNLLVNVLFLALTAVIAGLVPMLLFFRTTADRKVFIVGGLATILSYFPVWFGLPMLSRVSAGSMHFYPIWAIVLGFPVALLWKLSTTALPAAPTEEERLARIQRRAREKARRHSRS